LLNPYPLQENDPYSYEFVTDQGLHYILYFLDYSYIFTQYIDHPLDVYMFNIDVTDGNPDEHIHDERIGLTVLTVFRKFFANKQQVAIYICDNTDTRQRARKRKFDLWFWKYNDGSLLKEDEVAILEGREVYNSMILHKQNENLVEVILAFKELNEKSSAKH
jgi:hypothetical protein